MIFVDRKLVKAPSSLISKNSKGKRETKNAIIHFSKKRQNGKFTFDAYKEQDIKEALIKLFNGKCAYCESKILHIYPGDVEHFRPKSLIKYLPNDKIKELKPGYYWLAANWNNLLLACKNCNSPSTQLMHDGTKKVAGKWDCFPLSDPSKHARSPKAKLLREEDYRLLVNPCIDKPDKLFKISEIHGTIEAKSTDSFEILKAEKSIEIYGLDRMHLVHERKKVITDCFLQIRRIEEALNSLETATTISQKAKFTIILGREIEILDGYIKPSAPYSAVARQIYKRYFKQILK